MCDAPEVTRPNCHLIVSEASIATQRKLTLIAHIWPCKVTVSGFSRACPFRRERPGLSGPVSFPIISAIHSIEISRTIIKCLVNNNVAARMKRHARIAVAAHSKFAEKGRPIRVGDGRESDGQENLGGDTECESRAKSALERGDGGGKR